MPSKSKKQARLMAAVAHNPAFAKKVGIPQSVGRDFNDADQKLRKYAGGGKVKSVRELQAALDAWKDNKLPQQGFFSTLDELIATAPEEKMPVYMWQKYLQPGRKLNRDGIEFPLKQEEIDYGNIAGLHDSINHPGLTDVTPDTRLTKDQVRDYVRSNRPEIGVSLRTNDSRAWHKVLAEPWLQDRGYDPEIIRTRVHGAKFDDEGLRHRAADGDTRYEENITVSPDVGDFSSHFSPQDISWSRTTRHHLPLDQPRTDARIPEGHTDMAKYYDGVRLIEEIQSDRHSEAGKKIFDYDLSDRIRAAGNYHGHPDELSLAERRRGYRTPEIEEALARNRDSLAVGQGDLYPNAKIREMQDTPPDAPYKDPRDYATLEMRKQLLNSVNENDRFLALTTGQDQVARYPGGMDEQRSRGMREMYDKVYPSVLRKEAGRFGASMRDVEVPVQGSVNIRPPSMIDAGAENIDDLFDSATEAGIPIQDALGNAVDEMAGDLEHIPEAHATLNRFRATHRELENFHHNGSDEALDRESDLASRLGEEASDVFDLWQQLKAPRVQAGFKKFPAAEITPDVAERIKKVGVPIFSVGAAAASQMLPKDDEPPAYADGGSVADDDHELADDWYDNAKHLASGFMSQWVTVDPDTGKRVWNPFENDVRALHRLTGKSHQSFVAPGIVHETAALPELGELVNVIPHVRNHLHYDAPQWAHDASAMADRSHDSARDLIGVGEPHGFTQHALEALGTMGGQLPVPGSALNRLRVLRESAEVPGMLKRAGSAIGKASEWFTPTVEPKLTNYVIGTGVGAGIGTGLDKLTERARAKADIQEAMAQALAEAHDDSDLDEAVETMAQAAAPQAKRKFATGGAVSGVDDLRNKVLANDRTIKMSNPGYASIYDPPAPQQIPNAPGAASIPGGTGQNAQANFDGVDFEHYGQGPEHNFFPDRKYPPVVLQPGNGLPGGQGGGGGGSGSGSNAGSALGTVMGIIKAGGQVKDLYNRGRDLYNQYRYGNSAGAQTFDQWAAQNDPSWQQRAQAQWGGDLESLMTAAGSGILTQGATDPAGNVTVSALDGDQAQYNNSSGSGGGGGAGGAGAAVGAGAAAGTLAPLAQGTVTIAGLGADEAAQAGTQALANNAATEGASTAGGAGAGAGSGVAGALGKALAIYGAYKGISGLGAAYRQGNVEDGMMQGATAGASIGSVIPVVGTVAGGIIGGALGTLYTGSSNHTTESNTQKSAWSQFNKVPADATFRGSGFPTTAAFDGAMRTDNDTDPALLKAIGDKRGSGYPSSYYLTSYLKQQIREAQAAGKLPPDGQLSNIDGTQFFQNELMPKIYGTNGAPRNDKIKRLLGTMTDELFAYGAGKDTDGSVQQSWIHTYPSTGGSSFDEAASRNYAAQHGGHSG